MLFLSVVYGGEDTLHGDSTVVAFNCKLILLCGIKRDGTSFGEECNNNGYNIPLLI